MKGILVITASLYDVLLDISLLALCRKFPMYKREKVHSDTINDAYVNPKAPINFVVGSPGK